MLKQEAQKSVGTRHVSLFEKEAHQSDAFNSVVAFSAAHGSRTESETL